MAKTNKKNQALDAHRIQTHVLKFFKYNCV